jgi:hypothetical protein
MRRVLPAMLWVLGCTTEPAPVPPAALSTSQALNQNPLLSPTRQLRRVDLLLRGHEPTLAQYSAAIAAADAGTLDALIEAEIDASLASSDFYDTMLSYGHDYLRVGDYVRGTVEGGMSAYWKGGVAAQITSCPSGTMHAGALSHFAGDPTMGDDQSICDAGTAVINSVEPWWAPGTTVQVIGNSGTGATKSMSGGDCGQLYGGATSWQFGGVGCSCGPNLVYCQPFKADRPGYQYGEPYDSNPNLDNSARRLMWEEPARLFAYVVTTDQPFSDLVLGSYTVAPRKLQHAYVRWGRSNGTNASLDSSTWWKTATDSWDRVEVSTLNPTLLSDRTYTFDPRTDTGAPRGWPAAGVLTQLAPNVWFPRERVRAARWLETFACINFTAPDPTIQFQPPFTDDPERQGACQHCHQMIDPAAIHFKRLEIEDEAPYHGQGFPNLVGIAGNEWKHTPQVSFPDPNSPGGEYWRQPYGRWNTSFVANTFLTPITDAQLMGNADARFLDFLPPDTTLFGATSDGTIGPLGFGKLVVSSGQFDRCAVDKLFQHFMGRPIDVAKEAQLENSLVDAFVASNRQVKPWLKQLLMSDEFRRGL